MVNIRLQKETREFKPLRETSRSETRNSIWRSPGGGKDGGEGRGGGGGGIGAFVCIHFVVQLDNFLSLFFISTDPTIWSFHSPLWSLNNFHATCVEKKVNFYLCLFFFSFIYFFSLLFSS